MIDPNFENRYSLEKAKEELAKIGPGVEHQNIVDLLFFIKDYVHNIFEKWIMERENNIIYDDKVSYDFLGFSEKFIPIQLKNSEDSAIKLIDHIPTFIQDFFCGKRKKTILIKGEAGAGKSSLLKRIFLESVRKYKLNDPFPFFMDLSYHDSIKGTFDRINEEIKKIGKNKLVKFTLFTKEKYPMMIFLDSFDK